MVTSCSVMKYSLLRKKTFSKVSVPSRYGTKFIKLRSLAFYVELGSRRLGTLIQEDYKTSSEVKMSKVAADTRSLILERLPLFLHEHTHSRPRISYSWLTDEKNFIVKTFGKLKVTKSLNYGDVRLSRDQDASAAAKQRGYGPIELWLAGHSQVDMYE